MMWDFLNWARPHCRRGWDGGRRPPPSKMGVRVVTSATAMGRWRAMTVVRLTLTTLPPTMVAARRQGWGAILLAVEDFGAANKEEESHIGEEEEER